MDVATQLIPCVVQLLPQLAYVAAQLVPNAVQLAANRAQVGAHLHAKAAQRAQVQGLLRLMGRAALELGRLEAAAGHFESAVRLDPRDPEALDHLALVRFRQQRYAAALELYERLLEVTPDTAQVHANRGGALYYLGRIDAAVRGFERALSLDPALETARTALEEIRRSHPRPGS